MLAALAFCCVMCAVVIALALGPGLECDPGLAHNSHAQLQTALCYTVRKCIFIFSFLD